MAESSGKARRKLWLLKVKCGAGVLDLDINLESDAKSAYSGHLFDIMSLAWAREALLDDVHTERALRIIADACADAGTRAELQDSNLLEQIFTIEDEFSVDRLRCVGNLVADHGRIRFFFLLFLCYG